MAVLRQQGVSELIHVTEELTEEPTLLSHPHVSHHNIRDLPPDFNNIDDGYDHDHDDSDEEYPDKMSLRAATDSHSGMPLLEKDDDRERSRPRRLDALDAVESRSTSVLPPPVVSASSANA
ncbi:hypothetical protein EKO27_g11993, partial [Xylaria grammica]